MFIVLGNFKLMFVYFYYDNICNYVGCIGYLIVMFFFNIKDS